MLYCNVFIITQSHQLSVLIANLLIYNFSNIAQKVFYLDLMNAQSGDISTRRFQFFMCPHFCLSFVFLLHLGLSQTPFLTETLVLLFFQLQFTVVKLEPIKGTSKYFCHKLIITIPQLQKSCCFYLPRLKISSTAIKPSLTPLLAFSFPRFQCSQHYSVVTHLKTDLHYFSILSK